MAGDLGEGDARVNDGDDVNTEVGVSVGNRVTVGGGKMGIGVRVTAAGTDVSVGIRATVTGSAVTGVADTARIGMRVGAREAAAFINPLSAIWSIKFTLCGATAKRWMTGKATTTSRSTINPPVVIRICWRLRRTEDLLSFEAESATSSAARSGLGAFAVDGAACATGAIAVARPTRRSAPHAGQKRNGAGTTRPQRKQALPLPLSGTSMPMAHAPER